MKNIASWILRIFTAVIFTQTLYFKFTGHQDSVEIFSALKIEPSGRILIGILELVSAILILVPGTVVYGAILAWGIMGGAIIGHCTVIGFEGDNLSLFLLGVAVWVSATILLVLHRDQLPILRHMFEKPNSST